MDPPSRLRPSQMECEMKSPIVAAGFCFVASMAAAETPVLNIVTYDSFVSEWGPGPAIEKAFEATCGCDLKFTGAGDGAALLARVQLEGAASDADIVLGLDTSLTAQAAATGLFAPALAVAALVLVGVSLFRRPFMGGFILLAPAVTLTGQRRRG